MSRELSSENLPGIVSVRAGRASDQAAIDALVASERLNPNDINAENFVLAVAGDAIAGAVQLRRHPDGALELGSLVVRKDMRGYGLSRRLIEALLTPDVGPVHVITSRHRAGTYARWGFSPADGSAIPRSIRINRLKGQIFGGLDALLHGRRPQPLVILRRETNRAP